jgi:hypothetical protein
MDFLLVKGRAFKEHFNFKNENGKLRALPNGKYKIVLERGAFAREYTVENRGLMKQRTEITWNISAQESANFEYTTLYYTLYLDETELARGVLKIQ